MRHAVFDKLVYAKLRAALGGNADLAISGGAPLGSRLAHFYRGIGVTVLEGYGLTETTAAVAANTPAAQRIGTVGRTLPRAEVRIADDGEIVMRGPHVFDGYLHDERATAEAFADGWFRTGDIGVIEDGFLRITGRKKDIIITSSGKNVTPANIETALKESRWIAEAIVYGDNRPYLVALITLDPDEAPALAEKLGVPPDRTAMANDERVRAAIGEMVDRTNARFARIEQIKRFTILPHDLTQAEGELTPTLKVKRKVVYDRYAGEIDALYA